MAIDWVDNDSRMTPMDNDESDRSPPSYYSEDPSSSQGDYQGLDSQVDSYQGSSHSDYQGGSHSNYHGEDSGDHQDYYQGVDNPEDNYDDGGDSQGYYQDVDSRGDSKGDNYDEGGDNYVEADNHYHQDGPEQEEFDREVLRHTSNDRLVELETDDEISYVQSHLPQSSYHGSYNSKQGPDENINDGDEDDDDDDDDDDGGGEDSRYHQTAGGWIGKYMDDSESNRQGEDFDEEDTSPAEYTFGGPVGQQDTSERSDANMTNTYYQPTQFAGPMTPQLGNFQQYEGTDRDVGGDGLFQKEGPQQQQNSSPGPKDYGYEQASPLRSMENSLKLPMSDQDFDDRDGADDTFQMVELKRAQQWNMLLIITSCILLLALIVVVPVLVTRDDNETVQNVPIAPVPPVDSPTASPISPTAVPIQTPAPSSSGPRVCFETSEELQDAVDEYLAAGGDEAQLRDLISLRGWPIGTWCVSKITNFNSLFAVSRNMQAVNFNADLTRWDMSNATDLGSMFDGARVFDGDVTRWKTSQVNNMTRTFSGATQFNQDLSLWDVSKVTSLRETFFRASTFNKNIASWDVSRVTSMRNTFLSAAAFNQDLTAWQLDSVTDMNSMFAEAASFRQNMCAWGTQLQDRIIDVGRMFENTACPLGLVSPTLTGTTPGPFCFACILGLFPTESPTGARVQVPTASPTAQQSDLFQLICSKIPDCSVLRDTSTPQGQAFVWLEQPANSAVFTDTKKVQRYALATLYFSTSGREWSTSTFWLSSVDECLWFSTTSGSACTNDTREYQALELEKNILTGSLPFEISLLTSLKTVNLAGNLLQGELSSALGSMDNLETLLLQANFFSGGIPSGLLNLTKLTQLRLDNNDFVGELPESLCTLATSGQLTIYLDCEEVTASCFTTCCSNEAPCA